MHQIDESFRDHKRALQQRKARASRRRLMLGFGVFAAAGLAVALFLTADKWSINFDTDADLDQQPVIVETGDDENFEVPAFAPAVIDLAGDPVIIQIGKAAGELPKTRNVSRPATLTDPGIADRLNVLIDTMLSSSERFMTTVPSSQEDFAFFQAQRQGAIAAGAYVDEPAEEPSVGDPVESAFASEEDVQGLLDLAAGWGETVGDGQAELPEFTRTRIQNTTSVATVRSEFERYQSTEDVFVKVNVDRSLDSVALEHGFSAEDAKAAGEAFGSQMQRTELKTGEVVAMRGWRESKDSSRMRLMQVSIYTQDVYLGTLARKEDGGFEPGVDPWVAEDLFSYSGEARVDEPQRQYRILDAIYSTAARNAVPAGIIGEAIMLLSRSHDLNALAVHDDRFMLVFSDTPREGNLGRVLFVAVKGSERTIECFVYRPAGGGDFICMGEEAATMSQTVINGMVTPVNGVMTSTFGPRRHPILNTVRIHKGVDWAAPSGTPIFAAFDGEVVSAGDGAGYGNLVRIKHSQRRETRYAHLDRFGSNIRPGVKVNAGDVIGYVGTTGLSTGPHLHFELYVGGEAIDPLQSGEAIASDGSAADILVDQIIRVESAGNAAAKNPLSTATGLGQFIESTWLRMMRTYRPDLARSLSRADQLALRFDPTISREMVRNLAREGEAYLRSRGHAITAGRLYLCHFLGMDGAHVVLSANPTDSLVSLLGQSVISANPFLTGKDAAYVVDWAERKMRGRRGGRSAPVVAQRQVVRASPEFENFKAGVMDLVNTMTEAG